MVTRASFEQVNYGLRPSKQVERKLIIELLHRFSKIGFQIPEYSYLGFGSVFYIDFILFHKYLYIDDMVCVEHSNIPDRMMFNKPYRFIQLRMKSASDIIPTLSTRKPYLVWLDYDRGLDSEILQDIDGLTHQLALGSVLIVTVDADLHLLKEDVDERLSIYDLKTRLLSRFESEFGHHVSDGISRGMVSEDGLPKLFAAAIRSQIEVSFSSRRDARFFQLLNFEYADTSRMLTLGGLVGNPAIRNRLVEAGIYGLDFVQSGPTPVIISVPPLTQREKEWLDKNMTRRTRTSSLPFELKRRLLANYKRYYRHYPTYYETLF